MMTYRPCAAIGCSTWTDNMFFCDAHKTVDSRLVNRCGSSIGGLRAQAVQQANPERAIKAQVEWEPVVNLYRATHPDYWDGLGESPGAALRAMILDDECPF